MSEGRQFNQERLRAAKFHGCSLAQSEFDDVDLSQAKFKGVNLRDSSFSDINFQGAKLTNVSFANVSIEDANIDGLTIFGWNIADLIKEAQQRKASNWNTAKLRGSGRLGAGWPAGTPATTLNEACHMNRGQGRPRHFTRLGAVKPAHYELWEGAYKPGESVREPPTQDTSDSRACGRSPSRSDA